MIEMPKVSCKYPQQWQERSEEVDEILGAMGASWYQNFPDNLHRISSNPKISESIQERVKSYKRFRRDRFEAQLEQKNSSYSRERDTLLTDIRDYLSDKNVNLRRAEIQDAYGEEELPEDRVLLPRDERDIVAVLENGVELEELVDAAKSLGLKPSRVWEDAKPGSPWHGEEHMAVTLPDTGDSPETRSGMSVSIYPDDKLYIIGGANGDREEVIHREYGTAFQPFHEGEPSWNLKLFDRYLQNKKNDAV